MVEITVVIPIFNSEQYLENCIKSIIEQSFKNIQILLINDGSVDNSKEICNSMAKYDSRIEVFHKANEGVSKSRNFAISKAKGKYICFVDADDEIEKTMLEELHKQMEENRPDIVICGHKTVNLMKEVIKSHKPPEFNGTIKQFLERIEEFLNTESIQGPCGKLFKMSIIRKNDIRFPIDLSFGEDTFFVYRYLLCCKKITSISECYYTYVKSNPNSLSTSFRKDKVNIFLSLYTELEDLLNYFDVTGKKNMIERRICNAVVVCIGEMYHNVGLSREERQYFIRNTFMNDYVKYCFDKHKKANLKIRIINYLQGKNLFFALDTFFKVKASFRLIASCNQYFALKSTKSESLRRTGG